MFVADLHNDVLQRAMIGEDISIKTFQGHSDVERLQESCIDLEVFVIWIPGNKFEDAFYKANKYYEILENLEKENNIKIIKNLDDIDTAKKNNYLSTPFALEGGEAIENNIENLYHFINKGLFYFGPTWNHSLPWVSSNYDEKHNRKNIKSLGLNKFGHDVINICNENGVIIDVSHIGEQSFWDIDKISKKPFIASHSSVHKLCPHHRNLKDEQILAIKKSNGLIGLNPYPFFIDEELQYIHLASFFLHRESNSSELKNQLSNVFPHLHFKLYLIIKNNIIKFYVKKKVLISVVSVYINIIISKITCINNIGCCTNV